MARLTLLLSLFFCTCGLAHSQNYLRGVISDQATGEPLPFASIYVQETQTGAASNADGEYQIALKAGTNTVIFQYLGYQTEVKKVARPQVLDIRMNSQALQLGEVQIVSGGEDVSYSVIRRAIAKADFHLNQVERYTADVYIKGTGKINEVGRVIKLLAGKEGREEIAESVGRPFTTESTNQVTYERPNKYTQNVTQSYSIGDEAFDPANYIFTTFYQPLIGDQVVSPLNPSAFGYYKFEQLGSFIDQDKLINKIRVIPRSRGEDVFEGTIYIVQDDWSIHSLNLSTYKLGFKIDIKQNYAEVQQHLWMPITTTIGAAGSILGVDFQYDYLSTIGNYDITLNERLKGYVEVIDEKTQPEIAKRAAGKRSVSELEEALGSGAEVTRKDLRRLMKTYEKREREEREDPEVVSNYTFIDSSAVVVRDSASWAAVRPVPLTTEEIRGYAIADSVVRSQAPDSLKMARMATAGVDSTKTRKPHKFFRRLDEDLLPIFNPVQGYVLGANLLFGNQLKGFGFTVQPSYGFGWKRGTLEGSAYFGKSGYARPLLGEPEPRYAISGGRGVRQFNDSPSIDPWVSTTWNLLRGKNYIRLYERVYAQFDYKRAYTDELRLELSLGYEDRRALRNTANNNWRGLDDEEVYPANTPINESVGTVAEVNDAATLEVDVFWQPGLKYNVRNGRRELIEDSAPEIGFQLRQGVLDILNSRADFTQLQVSYEHRFDVGRKGKVQFLTRLGTFLNNSFVDFPDFKHFEGSEITIVAADLLHSYRLLPYYAESTQEEYVEVYAHYQFRKFLVTQFTALNLLGFREDLFVNYLYTPTSDNYTELGYSLDKIFRVFRVEFVVALRDFEYHDFGVRIGVATSLSEL